MSEPSKNENCAMENVESSENLEKSNTLNSSAISSVDESQDFHLVDFEEEECLNKSGQGVKNTQPEKVSSSLNDAAEKTTVTESTAMVDKEIESDAEKEKVAKEEETQETQLTEEKISGDDSSSEKKEKHSDEEEEIIQCTPPEVYSPSKKQVLSNTVTASLKRKAEPLDEPPTKMLKTSSEENISENSEVSKEKSYPSFKSDESQDFPKNCIDTNIIIAETQEVLGNEDAESTLDKPTKDEEKTETEKHFTPQIKECEMDKNENFSDVVEMNEAITSKETVEESYEMQNDAQVNENRPLPVQTKDSTSPPKTIEKVKSGTNNNSTDSTKSVEDKDTKIIHNEKIEDKENGIESSRHINSEQKNNEAQDSLTSKKVSNESHSNINCANVCKSRNSIELVYDRSSVQEIKPKSKEIVEIDEDGEKIVLDSSQDDSDLKTEEKNILDNTKAETTTYKSCYDSKSSSEFSYKSIENTKESSLDSAKSNSKLVNGSSESKRCDTDSTASLQSDTFNDIPLGIDKADNAICTSVHNLNKQAKPVSVSKDNDHTDLLSVSDNEPDVYIVDDKSKSNLTHSNSMTKALQVEKEIGIYVRMKCLLHVDEGTKEFLSKEITGVQCEGTVIEPTLTRQKNNDTSASLADISGNENKDVSPGSVNSNQQLYPLNPSSRLSFASTISSLSSVSSAASLAAKLAMRDSTHFSLPRAPAKHAKKHVQDVHSLNDKQAVDEAYDRLTKEWQNSHLLTTTILNFANTELGGIDTYNVSNERIDEQLQKIRSSTPEVPQEVPQAQTPKHTKKNKTVKRPRSKSTKSDNQSNGLNKMSSKVLSPAEGSSTPNRKKNKTEHTDNSLNAIDVPLKPLSQVVVDDLINKDVFAKWSDNNYYPGKVIDKIKMKYKVHFYDGKSKVLIEDFIITIPKVLKEGLSVYATTKNDDYGSCGIIIDTQTVNNEAYYIVETDEGEKLRVQVKDIFLSSDQAQVLKEEMSSDSKSLPSTPKHLGQVTLDNMVDGKRRSKRIATPSFSTPKTKLIQTPTSKHIAEPSVSGISSTVKKEKKVLSESDATSSDSNVSVKEETSTIGVQPEIIGTPFEQVVKGPQNRIKSKSRSKKKAEDEETIATFGPIPPADLNLFKGMSFILACASLETIDRYQVDNRDYSSDTGTENEEEWVKKPFVRDRLTKQIKAGGGKVYTEFSEIPKDEYKNTKLITNVPNTTAKTLLCLSVGIPAYNHNWIIRCCQESKIVSPAEDELPAGWSIEKQSYIEMFQRSSNKPLTQVVVIIPVVESKRQFIAFWRVVCENAGAVVLLADKPDAMEGFGEGTVVLTNRSCPSWAVEKATDLQIPLLSTTWLVQCLIEGKLCSYDAKIRYKYNYIQN
ncbi:uncharacterized protein LOC143184606 [Calliopsis andreniformis]|uniref:uncharacterized protein LOC143184606 n=1 Tax=Calliopsis andreniformis TaxID=337506 RepID=UPI003FCDE042